jgi:hypothetical protein
MVIYNLSSFKYQSQGTTIRQEWHCCVSSHCAKRSKTNILVRNLLEISINICLYQIDNHIAHFKAYFLCTYKIVRSDY